MAISKVRPLFLFALAALLAGPCCSPSEKPKPSDVTETQTKTSVSDPIGTATMRDDGTIEMMLRAEDAKGTGSASGVRGDALLTYPPSHPEYAKILEHLGGLKKGESKPVPPWPK
ncbi:MAG TPA: hypothetical protein VLE43_10985 [Candidatus Saccharimonadia bacterium]|nr:hypothetical protein [Candidatus Saccharimonadia bacterium]